MLTFLIGVIVLSALFLGVVKMLIAKKKTSKKHKKGHAAGEDKKSFTLFRHDWRFLVALAAVEAVIWFGMPRLGHPEWRNLAMVAGWLVLLFFWKNIQEKLQGDHHAHADHGGHGVIELDTLELFLTAVMASLFCTVVLNWLAWWLTGHPHPWGELFSRWWHCKLNWILIFVFTLSPRLWFHEGIYYGAAGVGILCVWPYVYGGWATHPWLAIGWAFKGHPPDWLLWLLPA